MPQVKIRLGAIVSHIYFAMLEGAHRSRIHVDIGIHFLRCDFQATRLEQSSEGSRSDALSEPRDYSSRNKDVLLFHV